MNHVFARAFTGAASVDREIPADATSTLPYPSQLRLTCRPADHPQQGRQSLHSQLRQIASLANSATASMDAQQRIHVLCADQTHILADVFGHFGAIQSTSKFLRGNGKACPRKQRSAPAWPQDAEKCGRNPRPQPVSTGSTWAPDRRIGRATGSTSEERRNQC